jgi:hypothetical protein
MHRFQRILSPDSGGGGADNIERIDIAGAAAGAGGVPGGSIHAMVTRTPAAAESVNRS